jgi:hypothetical protein
VTGRRLTRCEIDYDKAGQVVFAAAFGIPVSQWAVGFFDAQLSPVGTTKPSGSVPRSWRSRRETSSCR